MSTGKVVLGTAAGLAVGGILGILFAPEKGSVTRKQIIDKGNDYADDLKSKYNGIADTLKEKMKAVKKEAKDITEIGIDDFDKVNSEFNDEAKNF
ncbi:YtxH domain-containing protein [Flavobacterium sp. 5]|uniref:YtxH domain-containing protein n=1 Tax=Flavobacterium sp. 5 TaxID=2035199 RepID=UPI000C2BA3BF|nr:YtxH domain-containing protein [Flavobacterium sp. 5]PKB18207.1 gas vesicle protein [Flavobacterium sp. 5]